MKPQDSFLSSATFAIKFSRMFGAVWLNYRRRYVATIRTIPLAGDGPKARSMAIRAAIFHSRLTTRPASSIEKSEQILAKSCDDIFASAVPKSAHRRLIRCIIRVETIPVPGSRPFSAFLRRSLEGILQPP
jgi:hypothetical protein